MLVHVHVSVWFLKWEAPVLSHTSVGYANVSISQLEQERSHRGSCAQQHPASATTSETYLLANNITLISFYIYPNLNLIMTRTHPNLVFEVKKGWPKRLQCIPA